MLLKDDKKAAITLIMNRLKDGSSKMAPKQEHDDQDVKDIDMALQSSAEEILNAIGAKSAKRLKTALCSFFTMLDQYEDEEDEKEEEEAEGENDNAEEEAQEKY